MSISEKENAVRGDSGEDVNNRSGATDAVKIEGAISAAVNHPVKHLVFSKIQRLPAFLMSVYNCISIAQGTHLKSEFLLMCVAFVDVVFRLYI